MRIGIPIMLVAVLAVFAGVVRADPTDPTDPANDPILTLRETGGAGSSNNGLQPISSMSVVDPFWSGGPLTLSFDLGTAVALQPGDVLLTDPRTGSVSDVIRFETINAHAMIFWYSEAGEGDPPDVGLPTVYQTNLVSISEAADRVPPNATTYNPAILGPGLLGPGYNLNYYHEYVLHDRTAGTNYYDFPYNYQLYSPIPAPGAVVLGMIGLGLIGGVKKRLA
jgi:hypothetical protein